jgi:pimeloyl-ACP methyl ester carboxylesterase
MPDWTTNTVKANGLEIAYHRTGESTEKPPLVLLHGYTDNSLCWTPVARYFEGEYDVIMPDARGHGQTSGPIENMAVDLLAADTAAFIKALGLKRPAVFGHSMGGMQTLALVADFPDLVRAAVLEDPPFMDAESFTPSSDEQAQLEQDAHDALAFRQRTLQERIAQGHADNPGWSEDELLPWAQSKAEYDPAIVPYRVAFRGYQWRDALAKVQCPVLLVAPDITVGGFVTEAMGQEAMSINSLTEFAQFPGAGHSIHRDRFNEMMQRVSNFLAANP